MGRVVASSCSLGFARLVHHPLLYSPGQRTPPPAPPQPLPWGTSPGPLPQLSGTSGPGCSLECPGMPREKGTVVRYWRYLFLYLPPCSSGGVTHAVNAALGAGPAAAPGSSAHRPWAAAPTDPGDETHFSKVKTSHPWRINTCFPGPTLPPSP